MKKRRISQTAAPTSAFPYSGRARRSMLAARAVEGRTAALDNALDHAPTGARQPLPVIDREVLGGIAELAVGRGKIAQGRAARRNRFDEDRRDRRHQPLEPL